MRLHGNLNVSRGRLSMAAALAAAGLVGAGTAARADTYYFTNPSTSTTAVPVGTANDFTNPANWQDTAGVSAVPGSGDNAYINNGGTVLIQTGDAVSTADLATGTQNYGYGSVVMTGGSLTFNNGAYLRLAQANTLETNTSLFQISGGTVSGAGQIRVGEEGFAVYAQSGGTVTSNGDFYIADAELASSAPMGTFNMSGGTLNVGGYLNVGRILNAGNTNVIATLNLSAGGTINVPNRPISMSATTGVLNMTGGTLAGGSDLYLGEGRTGVSETDTFNISGGTATARRLGVAASDAGPNNVTTGTVNLNGGTVSVTQVYQGGGSTLGTFNFNGGTLQVNPADASNYGSFMTGLSAANVLTGGAVIDTNGQSVTVAQSLLNGTGGGADGGLTKLGAGVLTLAGTNTYTGPTAISAGALDVQQTTALPSGPAATTVANGAGLVLGLGGTSGYTTSTSFTGVATFAGPTASIGFDTGPGGSTAYGANITNASLAANVTTLGFVKAGGNTLTLTGINTYTGPTLVAGGTLQAGSSQAFGTNTALTVGNGATADLNGFSTTVGSLAGNGTVSLGGAATLTIGADNTSTTFSGNVNNGTGGSLVKVGTGTLTLANYDNNFTGGTIVNAGTINLANNYNAYYGTLSGPITINSGGTVIASLTDAIGYGGGVGTSVTAINVNAGGAFVLGANGLNGNNGNEGYRTNVVLTGGAVSATQAGLFNFTNGFGVTTNASGTTATFSAGIDVRDGSILPVAVAAGTTPSGIDLAITGPIVDTGGLAKSGPGTLLLSGTNTYTKGTTVSAGTLIAGSNAAVGTGAVTLGSGTALSVVPNTSGGRTVLYVNGLTLAGSAGSNTSKLDVGGNDLDLPGASLSTVTAMAAQGYAGGTWNGTGGIVSSAAAADGRRLTAVGVILNNASGTALFGSGTTAPLFDKAAVGASDVLVKYTYYGDANLDGKVDGADYALIDAGFLSKGALTGWFDGDFNYDGKVDASDYTLIDNAFNNQGAALTAAVADPALSASPAALISSAAVPEPVNATLMIAAGLATHRRRRRRM